MTEILEYVKRAMVLVEKSADITRERNPEISADRASLAEGLRAAIVEITALYALTKALPPDLGNIYDLPAELLGELTVAKTDELEDQIVTVINAYGGEASLDQILVGIYRKFGVIQKRRFMQNKLYRMEMVWSSDGKKGVYTTTKPSDPIVQTINFDEPVSVSGSADIQDEVPF